MEGTDRDTGRELTVLVFGDTADEIQLAALDAARSFFGDAVRLVIVPAYVVHDDADSTMAGKPLYPQAAGKKYRARVVVRTIETAETTGDPR